MSKPLNYKDTSLAISQAYGQKYIVKRIKDTCDWLPGNELSSYLIKKKPGLAHFYLGPTINYQSSYIFSSREIDN